MTGLYTAYVRGDAAIRPFFPSAPSSVFDTPPAAHAWDESLSRDLRGLQSPGSACAFEGNEPVIITGQQAGLLTGPLYTIYKAITAVKLADAVGRTHGVKCAPVFWVHGDDHDFAEVQTAHYVSRTHELKSLTYTPHADVSDWPMHRVPIEPSLHALIDQLAADVPGSELASEIQAHLHDTLDGAQSVADWMRLLMARLFEKTALILFSPTLPSARRIATEIMERELREPMETTRLVIEAGKRLAAAGYDTALVRRESDCNLFLEVDGRRSKLTYEGGSYRVAGTETAYSADDLIALLRTEPDRFTPNVVLRCLVQQRLFPVAAYVGGPGEVAYWAQFKDVFDRFGLPMPVVYPRAQAVLTTPKLTKIMKKHGLDIQSFSEQPDAVLERALHHTATHAALKPVRDRRSNVAHELAALKDELAAIDPGLLERCGVLTDRLNAEFDRLEGLILHADAARVETVRQQINRLCTILAPLRKPQERVLTIYSYLFEHGWGLVDRIMSAMDIEHFTVDEIEL
ncbi:MAG: putative cysteine ligase BshC [Candidatus Hydrogenedentota bacterium]